MGGGGGGYRHDLGDAPAIAADELAPAAPAPAKRVRRPEDILSAIAVVDSVRNQDIVANQGIETIKNQARQEEAPKKRSGKVKFDTLPFESLTSGIPLTITFYSPSGGVGKSSTAMNTGIYIATVAANMAKKNGWSRTPRVLAIDGDIVMGSLALRLTSKTSPNLYELQEYVDTRVSQNFKGDDAWPSVYSSDGAPTGERAMDSFIHFPETLPNFNILAAPKDPAKFWGFSELDYRDILRNLGRFYDVIIIDPGTELVLESQRAWLQHANEVFLVTSPDIDRIYNARKAAGIIASSQPHPRDDRGERAQLLPPLATKDKISLLMTRADANSGIKDLGAIVDKMFKWMNDDQKFWMPDVSDRMMAANNLSRFLVREDPEYAKVIGQMAKHAFQKYVNDKKQHGLPPG